MSNRYGQRGFTIIELLIAMVAFSSMALIASVTILQIGNMYYKGAVTINTQETTRSVMALISEQVQFTRGTVESGTKVYGADTYSSFCVGTNRYTYVINRILKPGEVAPTGFDDYSIPHVLWHDQRAGTCEPVNLADVNLTGGRELVGENMRLKNFSITNVGTSLADISIGIIYGDNDLIEKDGADLPIGCKGAVTGSQWCAMSSLSTQVFRRLT